MSKTKAKVYSISFTLGDKEYKGKGETMLDALLTLPMPEKIMGKIILTISDGVLSYGLDYQPVRTRKLYWKNAQPIIAKQLVMLLRKVKQ